MNQSFSSNMSASHMPVSCIDILPMWSVPIFALCIGSVVLSLGGNTIALIVLLCPVSKSRKERNRNRRIALESNIRVKFNVLATSSISDEPKPSASCTRRTESSTHNSSLLSPHFTGWLPRNKSSSFNAYLSSLAISDLLMALFCIPFTFAQTCLGYWAFPSILCPMVSYSQNLMVTASALTNTAISLNRLWGILHTMGSEEGSCNWKPFCHATTQLIFVWFIAICGSSVQLVVTRVIQEPGSPPICNESWSNDKQKRGIYSIVLFTVIYLIPLSIQIATYTYIGKRLWKRTIPGEQVAAIELSRLKQKRKIIKMLTFIVLMFGICWLPTHIFCLLSDFTNLMERMDPTNQRIAFGICHWIAMSNSFVNPIIYLLMSKSFKNECRYLLHCLFPCKHRAY